jgi:hypothetical protein
MVQHLCCGRFVIVSNILVVLLFTNAFNVGMWSKHSTPFFFVLWIICCVYVSNCYLLTLWSRVLLEKLTGLQLVNELPAFNGTRVFITAFTSAGHLSVFWASSLQSIHQHPTSWRSALYYPPIYAWVSPVISFHQDSPPKPCTRLTPPHIRATCSSYLILDFITRTILGLQLRSLSSSFYSFLHSPGNSYLLGPNILLNTLFPSTFSLRSSLKVSDHVSLPYKITGKIISL